MPRPFLQILFAVVLGLAATYYWDPKPGQTPDRETSARQQELPRTYLRSTRRLAYGEEGDLVDILEADSVDHFPQHDESLIEQPRFYSHSGDDRTWSATAERGIFRHRAQRLELRSDVTLSNDQTGAQLDTQSMDIEVQKQIARATEQVIMTQDANRTSADAMVANLNREIITLEPNVESVYVQRP